MTMERVFLEDDESAGRQKKPSCAYSTSIVFLACIFPILFFTIVMLNILVNITHPSKGSHELVFVVSLILLGPIMTALIWYCGKSLAAKLQSAPAKRKDKNKFEECGLCLQIMPSKLILGHRLNCESLYQEFLQGLPVPFDTATCPNCDCPLRLWTLDRSSQFTCRRCPKSSNQWENSYGENLFRCFPCGYDLCRSCANKIRFETRPLEQPQQPVVVSKKQIPNTVTTSNPANSMMV